MSSTFTNGVATITPELVNGYQAVSTVGTVAHEIIGRGDPDINFQPAQTRRGVLELLILTEEASEDAETAFKTPGVWNLDDPDRPSIAMPFVVHGGDVVRELEDATRELWLVRVPYREVSA